MRATGMTLLLLLVAPLAACGSGNGDNNLAARVESAADSRADAIESNAAAMKSDAAALNAQAKEVRKTGKNRADAIDAANVNANAMTKAQKDAIVAGASPAVR